jgi:hypothetical protein
MGCIAAYTGFEGASSDYKIRLVSFPNAGIGVADYTVLCDP